MVKLQSANMFLKDPVDSWGKEKTIGLSEHSARRLAPPITQFVKNGNILLWDGYEGSTKKYAVYQSLGGGTATRSIDYTQYEDFSLKCVPTGGAGDQVGAKYYITDFHDDTKVLAKASITSPDAAGWYFYVNIRYYDGTNLYNAVIRYSADGTIAYYDSVGVWQTVSTVERYDNVLNWGSVSLVIDLSKKKYSSARVYRSEFDLNTYSIVSTASAENPHVEVTLYFEDIIGAGITGYIDDVIVMENV